MLVGGEPLRIREITPPAQEFVERVGSLLHPTPDWAARKIRNQLNGHYLGECVDTFFVGEIHGSLVGHAWYGYAVDGSGIANFGEVYTAPGYRHKGIADALVRALIRHFHAGPAHIALCTAGVQATSLYKRHGFRPVIPGANRGPLYLLKSRFGRCFADYAAAFFQPGRAVRIGPGGIRHRHDIDCLLRFTHILCSGSDVASRLLASGLPGATLAGRVGKAWPVSNYLDAIFRVEDGRGFLAVAEFARGGAVGWAFVLRLGSSPAADCWILDFELHPAYASSASELIRKTLRMACDRKIETIFAECDAGQSEKINVLTANGFVKSARCRAGINTENQTVVVARYNAMTNEKR